jgi:hypothetical protein
MGALTWLKCLQNALFVEQFPLIKKVSNISELKLSNAKITNKLYNDIDTVLHI